MHSGFSIYLLQAGQNVLARPAGALGFHQAAIVLVIAVGPCLQRCSPMFLECRGWYGPSGFMLQVGIRGLRRQKIWSSAFGVYAKSLESHAQPLQSFYQKHFISRVGKICEAFKTL